MSTLLGFLDSKIKDEYKGEAWKTNKIGGHLCLSSRIKDEELNELKRLTICDDCKSEMMFIGQIGCPLEFDSYDRFLIFFACNTEKCGKWSIIRYLQNADDDIKQEKNAKVVQNGNSWLDDQNDWNDDNEWNEQNDKQMDEQKVDQNDSQNDNQNDEESNLNRNRFIIIKEESKEFIQPYCLDVDLENQTEDSLKLDNHIEDLIKQYNSNQETKDNEEYSKMEETDLLENYNNDILNYKFYKKLSLAPGQVIRYAWNQSPLVNSSNLNLEKEEIKCEHCGSLKIFELQLMPALINYLRLNDKPLNIDFATVLVYTCKQNCSTKMLTRESSIVLNEVEPNIPDEILNH